MVESEEEVVLYVEFNGMLHEDVLREPNLALKLIGFETDNPVLQIGDEVYEGEYEDANGTNVIFEENLNPPQGDKVFEKEVPKHVQYLCKTNKILKMNRIFISEKNSVTAVIPEETVPNLSASYQEALSKLNDCCLNSDVESSQQSEK